MPFALLMTDVLKRVEAGDPRAVKLHDRVIRLFRVVAFQQRDVPGPVLACDLKAIGAAERPHYNELVERIRSAVRNRSAISDGYVFHLDGNTVSLPEAAEWIRMERRCCPFLTLQLSAFSDRADCILTLTGPEGVKPFLDAEFPTA